MAQLIYTVTIKRQDILSEMTRMSSYEGRFAVTPSGESNYINVHITDQDAPLIEQETDHASYVVQDKLGHLVSDMSVKELTDDDEETYMAIVFTFILDSARTSYSELTKMVTEAIATYVMSQWLSERKSERKDFYMNLHEQMISGIQKSLTKKTAPVLAAETTETDDDAETTPET